ncbi:MAG: FxLYD domain-containing protein [Clostridia bacterium]|nr:FxLYD domain-containing protein [Clostridia bacterium]
MRKTVFKAGLLIIIALLLASILAGCVVIEKETPGVPETKAEPIAPESSEKQIETTLDPVESSNNSSEEKEDYSIGETNVSVWQDSIETEWVKVAVPVTNTGNANLYLETGTIDIEYSDGSLAQTLSMVSVYPQVIAPGETAYYFEETMYDGTDTEGLKLVPHVKAEKAKVDLIRFEVSDLQLKDEDFFGVKVIGRVMNNTDKDESMVYVVANLFDAEGKLIGQQFDILTDSLAAGDKIGFETSYLSSDLEVSDVANYEVIAFPYQYQW